MKSRVKVREIEISKDTPTRKENSIYYTVDVFVHVNKRLLYS